MSGADMALLFDTLKAANREHEYERLAGRGIALAWAGIGFATLLGGPVADLTSTRFTIFVGAATCLVTAAAAFAVWEPPRGREEGDEQPYFSTIGAAFGEAWHAVDVRFLFILAGTAFAALEAVHYLIQPFLLDRDVEVGVWFSLLQVPLLAAGLGGALIADRVMSSIGTKTLLIGPVLGAIGYGLLSAVPGLSAYAPLLLVVAMGSVVEPIATGYINRRIGSERRATVLSIVSMFRSLVLAFLAPLLGYATDQWGIAEAFAIGGVMAMASALAFGIPLLVRIRRDGLLLVEPADPAAAG
jgi:MFS family permease